MRRKWTEQQKRKILVDWHESESTRSAFCEKAGISFSSFDNWRRKFESEKKQVTKKSESKIDFVEIPTLDIAQNLTGMKILRIISSYGAVIEVPL